MRTSHKTRIVGLLSALLLTLAGCIVVDDFGEYWNKGFIDSCVNEIVMRDMEEDNDGTKVLDTQLRSLKIGEHTFLMMREHEGDKGGNLILYRIIDGDYITYRLNDAKREDFLKNYPNSGVVLTQETATIPLLNKKSVELLGAVSEDQTYWVENQRFPYNPEHRTDCIREPAQ